jgi:hypothetical protein
MFFSPQDHLIYEQDPQVVVEGAKFALKFFFIIIVFPLSIIGILALLSYLIVVPQFTGTELF